MHIKWYGHACFRITAENGTSIITDPYTPETSGYAPITEAPSIVVRSSDNDAFHCRADLIPGEFALVEALTVAQGGGEQTAQGIPFRAIEAMEALTHRDNNPEQNALYRFEVDGLHVGHMGDVGNALSTSQLEFFAGVDILLALAGGYPTIALDDLKTVIDHLQPRYVIPMHFRTLACKLHRILWIPSFLAYFDEAQIDFAHQHTVHLSRESLPPATRALILDYARA